MPDVYKQSFKQNYTNNIEIVHLQLRLGAVRSGPDMGTRHP